MWARPGSNPGQEWAVLGLRGSDGQPTASPGTAAPSVPGTGGGSGSPGGWGLGAYGPDRDDPRFVLMVVKTRETSTAGLIAGGMVDAVRDRLGGDLSPPRSFTDDARRGVRS